MLRRPLTTLVTATLVAIVGASCSLVSDFDNVAGTRPDDAGVDEPIVVDEGGIPEASVAFTCAGGDKLVCTTFDEGAVDRGGWEIEITGNGTATLDASQYTSPPASFHSKIGAAAKDVKIGATISQKVTTGAFTTLVYSFDLRMLSCLSETNGGSVTLAAIQPSNQLAFGLVLVNTNQVTFAQLKLLSGRFESTPLTVQPSREWKRFEVRISLSSTVGRAKVTVDGVTAYEGDTDTATTTATTLLNLGANATGAVKACDVVYDNVSFRKE